MVQVDELYNLSGVSRSQLDELHSSYNESQVVFKFREGVVHSGLLNSVVNDSEAVWLNEWKAIAVEL